jgi:hypothetical protein
MPGWVSVTLGTIIYDIRRDGGCILRDQADAPRGNRALA